MSLAARSASLPGSRATRRRFRPFLHHTSGDLAPNSTGATDDDDCLSRKPHGTFYADTGPPDGPLPPLERAIPEGADSRRVGVRQKRKDAEKTPKKASSKFDPTSSIISQRLPIPRLPPSAKSAGRPGAGPPRRRRRARPRSSPLPSGSLPPAWIGGDDRLAREDAIAEAVTEVRGARYVVSGVVIWWVRHRSHPRRAGGRGRRQRCQVRS